ncbi:MAG TPA: Hsp20/alpha crystallin family protein [Ktedonobacteraceae bacterium]|nr:Hsp20/alpha crystallin family protein [Ktedonobacteraceae bacterium]
MTLIRRDPFEAMLPLREAMNRLFEESFIGPRFEFLTPRTFPVDIYESEDKLFYVIEAALPGFKPEELHITAMGDTLTISAVKKEEEKLEKETYVRQERYTGEMTRTFTLPTVIDAEKIEAVFEHGVLKLSIPKAEEVKPKAIPIKVKELAGVR